MKPFHLAAETEPSTRFVPVIRPVADGEPAAVPVGDIAFRVGINGVVGNITPQVEAFFEFRKRVGGFGTQPVLYQPGGQAVIGTQTYKRPLRFASRGHGA